MERFTIVSCHIVSNVNGFLALGILIPLGALPGSVTPFLKFLKATKNYFQVELLLLRRCGIFLNSIFDPADGPGGREERG